MTCNVARDIDNKINKFQCLCGTINKTLRNEIKKETEMVFIPNIYLMKISIKFKKIVSNSFI